MSSATYPRILLDEQNIMHLVLGQGSVEIGDLRRANAARRAISTAPHPLLVYSDAGDSISIDLAAMSFCSSKDVTDITAALALVTRSNMQSCLAKIFLTFHRMPCPCAIFSNIEDASDWLRQFAVKQQPSATG